MSSNTSGNERRKLSFSRCLLVAAAFLLGLMFFLSAWANFIDRDDLMEVAGAVRDIERKSYWEDVVLYVTVQGARGRFKYEADSPGFAEFESALSAGTPVRLWVETASLELGNPAPIFEAEVNGTLLVRFDQTEPIHNRETWFVMLAGPVLWFLAFWIWHRATRRLPTREETAAYEARLEQIAQKHWLLFLVVQFVTLIRKWGEEIPKFGGLFTAFLFFWILPLYMIFIYVTAQSYRALVSIFCFSYWILLVALFLAAVTVPDFPGAEEYPDLGSTGSRLTNAYILLNLAYGGAMWVWGTLMVEPDEPVEEPASQ